jgi:hypothetical protein
VHRCANPLQQISSISDTPRTTALPNREPGAAGWFDPESIKFKVLERPVKSDIIHPGSIDKDGVALFLRGPDTEGLDTWKILVHNKTTG